MNNVKNDPSAAYLTDAVFNFGAAYTATQESLHNNNTSINAIQGQIQMLCNALGNQPPACMLQYPQQTSQGRQAQGGQHGQQQNQGQQGQPSGSSGGTNNDGGPNRLYRGNGNVSRYNQGSGMTFNSSGGSYPTQGISNPPSPIKKFKNWNYCHSRGGNVHKNHTNATCVQPGVNLQHAATTSNTMGGNNKGLHKTILPGAPGQRAQAAPPALSPTNYTSTFVMPFNNNGLRFPTAPGSWGFGPHAATYQCANNIAPPQPGTSMMANTMEFNNGFNYLGTMPAPPAYGQPNFGQSFYQNHI
jgi:hypothetical protein